MSQESLHDHAPLRMPACRCGNPAAKACPDALCGSCCAGCVRHANKVVGTWAVPVSHGERTWAETTGERKPCFEDYLPSSRRYDSEEDYCYDEDRMYEQSRRDAEQARLAEPTWTPPAHGLSAEALVAHHASCCDTQRVVCPICLKNMKSCDFCDPSYGDSHLGDDSSTRCARTLKRAGVNLKKVKRFTRLVVQYCTPHEGMSQELLQTFPGWPLQLNTQTAEWVQRCTEGWERLPQTKSFNYKVTLEVSQLS